MGSQLHSPRIREFPKESTPSEVDDAPTGILPSCQRTKDYRNQLENWENAEVYLNSKCVHKPYWYQVCTVHFGLMSTMQNYHV